MRVVRSFYLIKPFNWTLVFVPVQCGKQVIRANIGGDRFQLTCDVTGHNNSRVSQPSPAELLLAPRFVCLFLPLTLLFCPLLTIRLIRRHAG